MKKIMALVNKCESFKFPVLKGETYKVTELIYESDYASKEDKENKAIYVLPKNGVMQIKLYQNEYKCL